MTDAPACSPYETTLAKGAFAALIGVTPGRVSQMIREGLIGPDTLEERIKRERLLGAQIANRRAAEAEEARRGRYVETAELEAQRARIAAEILGAFEAALPRIARAMVARFGSFESEVLTVEAISFGQLSIRDGCD